MRYAVYYTPPRDDPLTRTAQAWLGRDAFRGDTLVQPRLDGFDEARAPEVTAAPRRYGFHATIVAPFRLADNLGEDDLIEALDDFCEGQLTFDLPLAVSHIGPFLALVPEPASPEMDTLAAGAVAHFSRFRAPLTDAEISRRQPEKMTPRQRALFERWGYPYVMEEFRFHMTLSGSLEAETRMQLGAALETHFASILTRPAPVGGLALFVEPQPGGPFAVHTYRPFQDTEARRSA